MSRADFAFVRPHADIGAEGDLVENTSFVGKDGEIGDTEMVVRFSWYLSIMQVASAVVHISAS